MVGVRVNEDCSVLEAVRRLHPSLGLLGPFEEVRGTYSCTDTTVAFLDAFAANGKWSLRFEGDNHGTTVAGAGVGLGI